MADKIRIKCSVCGDGVGIKGNHVAEHNYKYTGSKVICYGSFLPVFFDKNGNFQVGNIMYISSRHRTPWGEND